MAGLKIYLYNIINRLIYLYALLVFPRRTWRAGGALVLEPQFE